MGIEDPMARRKLFHPDLTLGEMTVLSELSHLTYVKGEKHPAQKLMKSRGISITVVRNLLTRVSNAIGPVELPGGQRRTLRPNALGRNVGEIGFLGSRLFHMARDPNVDQAILLAAIKKMTSEIDKFYEAGKLNVAARTEAQD